MKKQLYSIASCLLVLFSTGQADAGMRQYSADLNSSQWSLSDNSRLLCTLSHQIPHYGQAQFYSKASRQLDMEFKLDMLLLPDNYSLAEVRSVAPKWRPGVSDHTLTEMKLHKQFTPSLPKKMAWTMLSELEKGMNPTFYYNDWYNEQDKIAVALSTAKFGKAYHEFVGCVGKLLNYSFEDIASTVLNYKTNSDDFTKPSLRRMAMISQYLTLDPDLELVLIDAYSDSYGGRSTNQRLSERRAAKIREYFVANGVDPSRIEASGHGEKRHVSSNATTLGRGKNRRVVIRMEKSTPLKF
jgi:outer membrane protein OmpA-like peptidoglycan-associated protein